jgi:IS5 family transposase
LLRRAKKALSAEVVGCSWARGGFSHSQSQRTAPKSQRLHRRSPGAKERERERELVVRSSKRGLQKADRDHPSEPYSRGTGRRNVAGGYADDSGARRLLESLEHFVPLVEQGIAQATRRVLHDEQVPAQEKILSLFEEHTQIITRQKMGKPREFGRKVLIEEVEGGIISRYELLEEVGREHIRIYPPA